MSPHNNESDIIDSDAAKEKILCDQNVIMHCTLRNDCDRLCKVFEDVEDPHHAQASVLACERNDKGKSPVEMACMMGRVDILKELIKRGVDVTYFTPSGYSLMHYAASWGQLECLQALDEAGVVWDKPTKHGETPLHLAERYCHGLCATFISAAVAKAELVACIAYTREALTDPEKLQGVKLSKEEKNTMLASCTEKVEWLETCDHDVPIDDYVARKLELERQLDAIINKPVTPGPPRPTSSKK